MALLNILHYPDERLHIVAKPVKTFDDTLQTLIDDMAETMYEAPGIGLAATQVNQHIRLVIIDLSETKDQLQVFINPEIVEMDGQTTCEEGCLSVPGIYETVDRAERITVRALNRHGLPVEVNADGLLALCLQHEIDHLNGRVFVEKLSRLKFNRILQKLKKNQKKTM